MDQTHFFSCRIGLLLAAVHVGGGFAAQHSLSRVVVPSVVAGTVPLIVSLMAFLAVQWLCPCLYRLCVLSPVFNGIVVASTASAVVKMVVSSSWLYAHSRVVVFL